MSMSNAENPTPPTKVPGEDENFNEIEVDQAISVEDPEFQNSIKELASEQAKSELNIEMIDIDHVLKQEQDQSFPAKIKKLFRKVYSFFIRLSMALINWADVAAHWFLKQIKNLGHLIKQMLYNFKALSGKQKVAFFGIVLLIAGTVFYSYRALTRGWIHEGEPLFIDSLEAWSSEKYFYDPQKDMESFFDSVRVAQNLFNMKRIVANIRRSESSGANPMAAVEFYLEGNSAEVIVEVKSRESEFRDAFQRTIEESTYDQLASPDGKQMLVEKLRREVNKLITSGLVRRIYIKTIVIKP